jgi:1-aminocyclopropane-1-carboxylate deaminase
MIIEPITVKRIETAILREKGITLDVALLDSIHPEYGGNKWFKLKYNIAEAKRRKAEAIVTFGGAYSNHIYATAAVCKDYGIPCIGLIRGEEADVKNSTLSKAIAWGMQLEFLSRLDYAEKDTELFEYELHEKYGDIYIIPEGGANFFGINGCMEILRGIQNDYDLVAISCGTGTTLTGVLLSAITAQKILGYVPMKGGMYLRDTIFYNLSNFLGDKIVAEEFIQRLELFDEFHFGGFAKINDDLKSEKYKLEQLFGFELDYVYTAKMFYGLFQQIKQDKFQKGTKILALHTGGLQGNRGYELT